jgi:hypothetical protein
MNTITRVYGTIQIIAVALLIVSATVSGCRGLATSTTASSSSAAASVGQEVRDGKFAFTVTKVDADHRKSIGDQTAQGEFVVLTLTVKNIGNEPQTYSGANQKLKDAAGKTDSNDDMVQASLQQRCVPVEHQPRKPGAGSVGIRRSARLTAHGGRAA